MTDEQQAWLARNQPGWRGHAPSLVEAAGELGLPLPSEVVQACNVMTEGELVQLGYGKVRKSTKKRATSQTRHEREDDWADEWASRKRKW